MAVMNWFAWVLVLLFALESIGTISLIGKTRSAVTNDTAIFVVILKAALIFGIFYYWGGR